MLKNTPQHNWLLWHFEKGKKQTNTYSHAEERITKIKREAEKLEKKVEQERTWFETYKKSHIAKINLKASSPNIEGAMLVGTYRAAREQQMNKYKEMQKQTIRALLEQGGAAVMDTRSDNKSVNQRNTNTNRTDYRTDYISLE